MAKQCKEDIEEITGQEFNVKIDTLNAMPQQAKVNKFGLADYNRDGWPVWPSIYESQSKEAQIIQKKARKKARKENNQQQQAAPPLPPQQVQHHIPQQQHYGQIYRTDEILYLKI